MRLPFIYKPVYFVLLLFAFMLANRLSAQTCGSCTKVYPITNTYDIVINDGDTVCVSSGVLCNGTVLLNGGVLCNSGTIQKLILDGGHGLINNYGAITNLETYVSLPANLTINNAPGALLTFSKSIFFDMSADADLTFIQYNGSKLVFTDELNINTGNLSINNGVVWPVDTTITTRAYFNLVTGNFNGTALSFSNSATGIINAGDSFNMNELAGSSISNKGTFNVYDAFTISGGGDMTINNSAAMYTGGDFQISDSEGNFTFNNSGGDSSSNVLSVDELVLNNSKGIISIDSSSLETNNNLRIVNGTLNNNGFITVNGSIHNSGRDAVINNTKILSAKNLYNTGPTAIVNNYNLILLSDSLTNEGETDLYSRSWLYTNVYYNNGSVQGITDDGDKIDVYPRIFISGSSENDARLSGKVVIHDISLLITDQSNDKGFDVVHNPSLIGTDVHYITTSKEGTRISGDCSLMPDAVLGASWTSKNDVLCGYGGGTLQLHSGISFTANVIHLVTTNVTYHWEPGNIDTQNPVVPTPSSTTVYTVSANYGDCIFTQTVQVTIGSDPVPVIQYTSTPPYFSTSTATFNVTQSGPTGWIYSIAPTSTLVSIDSLSGHITAHGNSFGQYTVSYCPVTAPSTICGLACTTTTLLLKNLACPFNPDSINTRLSLCAGDRVQLLATGGITGSFFWSPAPTTPTAGLSCTACTSPTLMFDGTPAHYTVTSYRDGLQCGSLVFTVSLKPHCQKEEIIGCCFGNYGAAVRINSSNTYLNIYCNLVNEVSSPSGSITSGGIEKGKFQNENGTVRVLLDWIHNAGNGLYIASSSTATPHEGISILFGANQNIKGNSHTEFNELSLEGSGTKTIWIDEYGYSKLNLNDKTLELQNFNYAMKNRLSEVTRTSGYVSNGINGYFSWLMSNAVQQSNQKYLFPLGAGTSSNSSFMYRPMVMANNSTSLNHEISANFVNAAPSFSNDADFINASSTPSLINKQAPNVLQINNSYYHKMKHSSPPDTGVADLNVKLYYLPGDGQFQSLAEWKKDPAQTLSWWGTTPGSSASTATSTTAETYGMLYAMSNGSLNFNFKPFTLARGGFYINTSAFGDNNGNNGTTISLTSSPLPGNSTPTGGGLNSFFGTGGNSGNNGSGGGTIFTPNPVAGEYVISTTPPNSCAVPNKIRFVIDNNGNIAPSDVKYGNSSAPPYLGELSEAVYSIDTQNTGMTLNATPKSLLRKCVNTVTVNTSVSHDFILDQPSECIQVYLPAAATGNIITYGTFKLYSASSTLVLTSATALSTGTNTICLTSTLTPGPYRFELPVTATGIPVITETIKGQLIIK